MAEHKVELVFNLDDDVILTRLEKDAYNDIINSLKQDFIRSMPKLETWNSHYCKNGNNIDWDKFANKAVKDVVDENKEEIIDRAAQKLCNSFNRSKAFKDVMVEKLNNILEE